MKSASNAYPASLSLFFLSVFLKQAVLLKHGWQERKVKRDKLDAGPVVELILELNPGIKQKVKKKKKKEFLENSENGNNSLKVVSPLATLA